MAHSRILEFFKRPSNLAGPIFDLEELWDLHTFYEFEDRSVAKTMGVSEIREMLQFELG